MQKLGWGILGTGFISKILAQAINEVEDNFIAAVGSRDIFRAREFAAANNVAAAYANYQSVIDDPNVAVVYIGLPNHLHAEWIIRAAKANKAILCEKPFTVNTEEAKVVLDFLAKKQVFCVEALMYRFHPLIEKLISIIQSGVIGNIRAFDALYADNIHHLANTTAGGSIMDLGCYPVSLIRLLTEAYLGCPFLLDDLTGIAVINEKTNTDNFANCNIKFNSGIAGSIVVSNQFGMNSHFRVIGTNGIVEIKNPWLPGTNDIISVRHFNDNSIDNITVDAVRSPYFYEVSEVSNCIRNSKLQSAHMTLENSYANMILLDAWRSAINLRYVVEEKSALCLIE